MYLVDFAWRPGCLPKTLKHAELGGGSWSQQAAPSFLSTWHSISAQTAGVISKAADVLWTLTGSLTLVSPKLHGKLASNLSHCLFLKKWLRLRDVKEREGHQRASSFGEITDKTQVQNRMVNRPRLTGRQLSFVPLASFLPGPIQRSPSLCICI